MKPIHNTHCHCSMDVINVDNPNRQQTAQLAHFAFKALLIAVEGYVKLTGHNWKKYDASIMPYLIEEKFYFTLSNSTLQTEELQVMQHRLDEVEYQVTREPYPDYYTLKLPERQAKTPFERYKQLKKER